MAAHRYWRFNMRRPSVVQQSGGSTRIYALEFFDASNVSLCRTVGGTASASSANGTFNAAAAFDSNDNGTYWENAPGSQYPHWLAWDFGSGNERDVVKFRVYSANATTCPCDCPIEWSDDATTWTPALYFPYFGLGALQNYDYTSSQPYVAPSYVDAKSLPVPLTAPMTWAYVRDLYYVDTRLTQRWDRTFEGDGRIASTVKADTNGDGTGDVNLHREVRLIDEQTLQINAITWSDAVTGAYSFDHIRRSNGASYTVYAIDYEHNYRAVIADRLVPEAMP